MTDISRILDGLFADLGDEQAPIVPTLPTRLPTNDFGYNVDIVDNSHTSHTSHTKKEASEKTDVETSSNAHVSAEGSRVTSSYAEDVGSVGSVGSEAKTLAGSTPPFFPQDLEDVGSVGSESGPVGRALLDLIPAASQRDNDPLSEEIDRVAVDLPIQPEQVHSGVRRELRSLADLGVTGPEAQVRAVAITRAKIRNSEALAERQIHDGMCYVCGDPLDDTLPVISVLTSRPGAHLHLHSGCHAEHVRRRAALVDSIMKAAGYGADRQGEAV